ncbi:hypothetical protein K438DRAFT_1982512 [Mycena galopus ATCC 62051]|nr:hypothetical protein K438DRAFT_1982512 [Mycena galopus ATCC 62051]
MLSALDADRANIPETAAQIAPVLDLERSLSELRAEKTLSQEPLHSYKCPVLALPDEILSEIFIHFLPTYPLCPPLTGSDSPTFLTHIYRKWRAVSLATPMLWRAIELFYDHNPSRL